MRVVLMFLAKHMEHVRICNYKGEFSKDANDNNNVALYHNTIGVVLLRCFWKEVQVFERRSTVFLQMVIWMLDRGQDCYPIVKSSCICSASCQTDVHDLFINTIV